MRFYCPIHWCKATLKKKDVTHFLIYNLVPPLCIIVYSPASEASRGVYWNQAQKNFTHPYIANPWVSLCNSGANKFSTSLWVCAAPESWSKYTTPNTGTIETWINYWKINAESRLDPFAIVLQIEQSATTSRYNNWMLLEY